MTDDTNPPARAADILPLRPRRPCPICGKDSQREAYPFCSKRCKDIDLNSWLSGRYAIPAVESDDGVDAGDDDGPAQDR